MKSLTDRALKDMRGTSAHVLRTSSILQTMKGTKQVTVQSMYSALEDKLKQAKIPQFSFANFFAENSLLQSNFQTIKGVSYNAQYPSDAVYRVVKLILTATDLPNLEKMGKSDPYFKIYGYRGEKEEILYTSEVVGSCVDFVEWKPAIFGVPKSLKSGVFKVYIFDKEMFGKDQLIAGPVDIQTGF